MTTVKRAQAIVAKREREARSQYARDVVEAGKLHGLDIPVKTRDDGEVVLLDDGKLPAKVPFGMLFTLVQLRAHAYRIEGRVEVARGMIERLNEAEEDGWTDYYDGITEDNAEAFQTYADAILDANGAGRIETDVIV